MLNNSVVIINGIIPTIAHESLISFASHATSGEVVVIVNSQKGDKYEGYLRHFAYETYALEKQLHNVKVVLETDTFPRYPETQKEWGKLIDVVRIHASIGTNTAIIGSDEWDKEVAGKVGCKFLPFDMTRAQYPETSSTTISSDIYAWWDNINKDFRKVFKKDFVIIGSEGTGKTTISKLIPWDLLSLTTNSYLHELGTTDLTTASIGQYALQQSSYNNSEIGITIFDTDLLYLIGQYRLAGISPAIHNPELENNAYMFAEDYIYFILPDDVPFDGERTSDRKFWKDLCEDFGAKYYYVPKGTNEEKVDFIYDTVEKICRGEKV